MSAKQEMIEAMNNAERSALDLGECLAGMHNWYDDMLAWQRDHGVAGANSARFYAAGVGRAELLARGRP